MKRLPLLFTFVLFALAACSEPLTIAEIQSTQEAEATAFAVTQAAVADGVLVTVRDVAPEGSVVAETQPGRSHDSELRYEFGELPPTGGTHSPTWQRCGIYDSPIRPENALHSMEHGAVWITYQEDLSADAIRTLESAANSVASTLLSPYPNQRSPVVLTAWAVQLELDSADDPRVQEFIDAFARGPQTPEPEANCATGTDNTMDG